MDIIEIAKECGAEETDIGDDLFFIYRSEIIQFAKRIEAPHKQRIAELEQELHYANQAARFEADICDQAMADMKRLREALLHVRQSMYINDYGDWALQEGFNGFDITPVDKALEGNDHVLLHK